MTQPITMPSASTRKWERQRDQRNAELRSFLKSKGVSSKAKIKDAVRRASVKAKEAKGDRG